MPAVVSVLIPCYNAERWLGETLESVFRQSWKNLEVIVVDDGSKDNSCKVVETIQSPRLKLIRQSNCGAAVARNRALNASRGEFIQYIDADDLLNQKKIELQMERLIRAPDCLAMAEWARFYGDPDEAVFGPDPTWRDMGPVDWLVNNWESGAGMMYPAMWLVPRKVVNLAGSWDPSFTLADDTEYFARVVLAARRILFCEGARSYYRSGISGSLSGLKSRSGWESQFAVLEACERYLLDREDSDRTRRACAMLWQRFAHGSYPHHRTLANRALARSKALHAATIEPEGGPAFRMVSRLFGWKVARLAQRLSGRA